MFFGLAQAYGASQLAGTDKFYIRLAIAQSASDVLMYGTVAGDEVDEEDSSNRIRRAGAIEILWENVIFSGEPSVLAERIQATVEIHVPVSMGEATSCAVRVAMDSGAVRKNLEAKSPVFSGVEARFISEHPSELVVAAELAAC